MLNATGCLMKWAAADFLRFRQVLLALLSIADLKVS